MKINTTNAGQKELKDQSNECPFCHRSISPNIFLGHLRHDVLDVFMCCPDSSCNQGFIGYYNYDARNLVWVFSGNTSNGNIVNKVFSDTINMISPTFSMIYNQSYYAEQNGLFEICGVGYRKALEFLIKDYSVLNAPDERKKIEKIQLGPCIDEYVSDLRIKAVAKRAVWLGNDETHYLRKWEGKNLEDLKKLIDLTIHWIEMEALTKSFETDMPE